MSEYGIPYMGSKAKIIASIATMLPGADHFYDLFGGGFAVSHYMLARRGNKYKNVHYNELNPGVVELVKRAISGEYSYKRFKPEWISRERFFAEKDHNAYIRVCWSFGNNQKNYLFGDDIEQYKKSMHQAIVFDEFDDLAAEVLRFKVWPDRYKKITQRRFYLRQLIEHYRKTHIPKVLYPYLPKKSFDQLRQLQQLQQLEQLQRLEKLERLQQLPSLSCTSLDYADVPIETNSVIYCDPPYKGTAEYLYKFDHARFLDWAASMPCPVFISEYDISDARFKCIYQIAKASLLVNSGDKKKYKQEKLYWNGVSNG